MPKKLEKCVAEVKAEGTAVDPWAVCTASLKRARKLNPNHRDVKKAMKLYKEFREASPRRAFAVDIEIPTALMSIGNVQFIGYDTTRRGKTELYKHDFAPGSRPVLCADGKTGQLFIIGGRYHVTARGIVDLDPKGKEIDD
jgi:hypothetical protein